jgi:hypothetical protein
MKTFMELFNFVKPKIDGKNNYEKLNNIKGGIEKCFGVHGIKKIQLYNIYLVIPKLIRGLSALWKQDGGPFMLLP